MITPVSCLDHLGHAIRLLPKFFGLLSSPSYGCVIA